MVFAEAIGGCSTEMDRLKQKPLGPSAPRQLRCLGYPLPAHPASEWQQKTAGDAGLRLSANPSMNNNVVNRQG